MNLKLIAEIDLALARADLQNGTAVEPEICGPRAAIVRRCGRKSVKTHNARHPLLKVNLYLLM